MSITSCVFSLFSLERFFSKIGKYNLLDAIICMHLFLSIFKVFSTNFNHSMSFNIRLLSTTSLAFDNISRHFSTGDFISNLPYFFFIFLKCDTFFLVILSTFYNKLTLRNIRKILKNRKKPLNTLLTLPKLLSVQKRSKVAKMMLIKMITASAMSHLSEKYF